MNASFQKLFHGNYCHLHAPPKFGFCVSLRQDHFPLRLPFQEAPSTESLWRVF
ncbi:hypothetical protein HMPREF9412_5366 [Paenibacillus sp. HGF5]|nr:hypothetical protein HMPREF9412_5366 [Paenibacillus sp. HGF5]